MFGRRSLRLQEAGYYTEQGSPVVSYKERLCRIFRRRTNFDHRGDVRDDCKPPVHNDSITPDYRQLGDQDDSNTMTRNIASTSTAQTTTPTLHPTTGTQDTQTTTPTLHPTTGTQDTQTTTPTLHPTTGTQDTQTTTPTLHPTTGTQDTQTTTPTLHPTTETQDTQTTTHHTETMGTQAPDTSTIGTQTLTNGTQTLTNGTQTLTTSTATTGTQTIRPKTEKVKTSRTFSFSLIIGFPLLLLLAIGFTHLLMQMTEFQQEVQSIRQQLNAFFPLADNVPNFALKSQGAYVRANLSSKTYWPHNAGLIINSILFWWYTTKQQANVIQGRSFLHPGECWPFSGDRGHLFITLSHPVSITHVTLGHITKRQSPSGFIASAPREFSVYGLQTTDEEGTFLGKLVYDQDGAAFQTFQLTNPDRLVFRHVNLQIENNWGDTNITCLYSFRVHSDLLT